MGLKFIPGEIGMLTHLEILDVSVNELENLPQELQKLSQLKRLFLTKNKFKIWPGEIFHLSRLEMLSLKSNSITSIPETDYLPRHINWLILTDNLIESLPENFGFVVSGVKKLALSGNRLESLPASFSQLSQLELVRLSNNKFVTFPPQVLNLPKLAWVSLGGNPCSENEPLGVKAQEALESLCYKREDFIRGEILGTGASGTVHLARSPRFPQETLALKVFKAVTSDGKPEDELMVAVLASSGLTVPEGLIPFRGWTPYPELSLIMDYIPGVEPLGNPPSLDSITRDCYSENWTISWDSLLRILVTLARVQKYLGEKKICHGDFYAHNILFDQTSQVWLGDWGASFFYERNEHIFEKFEVRAFGYLAQELVMRTTNLKPGKLEPLIQDCLNLNPRDRPNFQSLARFLQNLLDS